MDLYSYQLSDGFIVKSNGCFIDTDKFICNKCNNRKCLIIERYLWSYDEGMTYLLYCKQCHKERRLQDKQAIEEIEKIKKEQSDKQMESFEELFKNKTHLCHL